MGHKIYSDFEILHFGFEGGGLCTMPCVYIVQDALSMNHFGLDSSISRWRSPLSLRGLTAKDSPDQFYENLIVGASQDEDINRTMERCTAMAVHNVCTFSDWVKNHFPNSEE